MITGEPLMVLHVGGGQERFRCRVNNIHVNAHADTGAKMDLMSAKFVRQFEDKIRPLKNKRAVQFADGSLAWVTSQAFTRFSPLDSNIRGTSWIANGSMCWKTSHVTFY